MNPILETCADFISTQMGEQGPLEFVWDEWDVVNYIEPIDEEEIARLDRLAEPARLTLALANLFWIRQRLKPHGLNPLADAFLEMSSASAMYDVPFQYVALNPDEWRGPMNGPFAVACDAVNDAIHDQDFFDEMSYIVFNSLQMARRAMSDTDPFEAWYNRVRDLLAEKYPAADYTVENIPLPPSLSEVAIMEDGQPAATFSFSDQQAALSEDNALFSYFDD